MAHITSVSPTLSKNLLMLIHDRENSLLIVNKYFVGYGEINVSFG